MLEKYDELRKVDVRPYCEERDEGKEQTLYLNWAKCIDLLHQHGAEKVFFEPMRNENGSSLILSERVFKDKNDISNCVYETRIRITIDDDVFEYQGPVMNGGNPVKDNSMSQQRLWNSQCRLFVKAIAIHTGLGFDLWIKNEEKEEKTSIAADVQHSIMKVRDQMLEKLTTLNKRGLDQEEIAKRLEIDRDELDDKFKTYARLAKFEEKINKVLHDTQ